MRRPSSRLGLAIAAAGLVAASVCPAGAQAQPAAADTGQPTSQTFTFEQALQYAADHYPTIKAAMEETTVSAAGIDVARAAYLPRLDSVWQSNRATANNQFGLLLPQSVLPAISGPVLTSSSATSIWSSAVGALASWEPFDFGLRHATVAGAESALTRARTQVTLTKLDVQQAVAAAFLGVLATDQAVIAAEADVNRRDVLRQAVQTLVDNQLRPGADASRADAERAAAETRLLQAQQAQTLARTTLTRVLGMGTGLASVDGQALLTQVPPSGDVAEQAAASHPLAQVHEAAVAQAKAQEGVLARTDWPRLWVQSAVFGRGSGGSPTGGLDGGIGGLGFDRANWAAGVQVVFPNAFDFSSLRARRSAAAAATRAESALYEEALLAVTSEQQASRALLQTARGIAANTPVQLASAQQSEAQARARYDAGLASIVEVADAQSLLAQAEVQDQIARVDVWRALVAVAVAQGDVTPLLRLIRQP